MVQITNRGFMGSKWLPHARTMIFWSRSYLCIYFPWNSLDFGDANSLKVYIFSLKPFGFWRRQFIKSPYLHIYFPWNPLDFGDANSLKALVNKGTLYSLKLWIPWTFCYLWNIWALHISYYIHINRLTPARSCVMLGYPEAWGRGEGTPYPLKLWSPLVFGPAWVNWGRKWIFAPLETLGPKLYCVGAPRGMG